MYSVRGTTYRNQLFDRQCKRFVKDVFTKSEKYNTGLPEICGCSLNSIFIEWEDEAILSQNPNTPSMDSVLDEIISL